ncbi:hypothetical protein [Haloferula sp. BvORR071]|uniref:hypothetical protein n=1 Tax=Haloferula sp. BvORR071 TaxID=1396141 RepID=UPI000555A80E|nr:hypothetical protein [Haloferula sp. BvORR071]
MKALLAAFVLLLAQLAVAGDVQVTVYQVEVNQERMSALLAEGLSDAELFKKLRGMVAARTAKLRDASSIRVKSGGKGTLESNREVIYLTEYDPDSFASLDTEREKKRQEWMKLTPEEQQKRAERALLAFSFFPVLAAMDGKPNFESRKVGMSLEVDGDPVRGVRWSLEQVDYVRDSIMGQTLGLDGKPRAQRMPAFDSLRLNGNSTGAKGVSFAGALTPVEADGSLARDRKIMVFVKADLLK